MICTFDQALLVLAYEFGIAFPPQRRPRHGCILSAVYSVAQLCPAPWLFGIGKTWNSVASLGASTCSSVRRDSAVLHGFDMFRQCFGALHVLTTILLRSCVLYLGGPCQAWADISHGPHGVQFGTFVSLSTFGVRGGRSSLPQRIGFPFALRCCNNLGVSLRST